MVEKQGFDIGLSDTKQAHFVAQLMSTQPFVSATPVPSLPHCTVNGWTDKTPAWESGLHFLVVDDSAMNRKVMRRLLMKNAHKVTEAVNGVEFLKVMEASFAKSLLSLTASTGNSCTASPIGGKVGDVIATAKDIVKVFPATAPTAPTAVSGDSECVSEYDVVLMDHLMPLMNGAEATQNMRERGYRGLIIGLTGHCVGMEKESFQTCGVDLVMSKPLNMQELQSVLCNYFEKRKQLVPMSGYDTSGVDGNCGRVVDVNMVENIA